MTIWVSSTAEVLQLFRMSGIVKTQLVGNLSEGSTQALHDGARLVLLCSDRAWESCSRVRVLIHESAWGHMGGFAHLQIGVARGRAYGPSELGFGPNGLLTALCFTWCKLSQLGIGDQG